MGIDAVWKSEFGEELGRVGDARSLLSRLHNAVDLGSTTCLRFIDPYGDTIFNQAQRPTLVEELEWAAGQVQDQPLASHLQDVCTLAKRAEDVHTYLWFIGD